MLTPPIDAELQRFLEHLHATHPLPRDPNDLAAYCARYEAASRALPSVQVPVSVGDFHLTIGSGPAAQRLAARMYMPVGAREPVLMAWFHGGGWVAGSLDSHDGLCRQLSHDLGVAVASVHIAGAHEQGLLQGCEDALRALGILANGRARLAADPRRLLVGGDGSGAHLALQAAWRLQRRHPGCVDAVLGLYPLAKPDFNTMSYLAHANSLAFARDDAVRAWQGLLQGRWEIWDERAVLMHGNAPLQRPPAVMLLAAECDGAHDDAIALHDWLRAAGARCEFLGAPRMTHDFARLQHASPNARRLLQDALQAFIGMAQLQPVPAPS
jgi:acetyl esterase